MVSYPAAHHGCRGGPAAIVNSVIPRLAKTEGKALGAQVGFGVQGLGFRDLGI